VGKNQNDIANRSVFRLVDENKRVDKCSATNGVRYPSAVIKPVRNSELGKRQNFKIPGVFIGVAFLKIISVDRY